MKTAAVACAISSAFACGIPEQSLRDEQLRTRRYRDAWESLHEENQALRSRTEELQARLAEQQKKSCGVSASTAAPSDPLPTR